MVSLFGCADPTADPSRYTELAYKADGVLVILGTVLDPILIRHPAYKDGLQSIAQDHILPLFASPYPFLRAKACWLAGVFVRDVKFTTADGCRKKGHGELFDQLFDSVLRCMKDTCGRPAACLHLLFSTALWASFSLLQHYYLTCTLAGPVPSVSHQSTARRRGHAAGTCRCKWRR